MAGLVYHGRVCLNNLIVKVRFNKSCRIVIYHCCNITFSNGHSIFNFCHRTKPCTYLSFSCGAISILSIDDRYFLRMCKND